jgi:hypothetical protein
MTHNVISLPSIDALRKAYSINLIGGGLKARQERQARQKSALQSFSG